MPKKQAAGTLEEIIRARYRYDKDSGQLYSKETGLQVGAAGANGYAYIYVNAKGKGHSLRVHRVAWLLHYGHWPKMDIDHINRVRSDNRIRNLREASKSDNSKNTGVRATSKSGIKGVRLDERTGKWIVTVSTSYLCPDTGNSFRVIGEYDDRITAAEVYDAYITVAYGEFAVTNASLGII